MTTQPSKNRRAVPKWKLLAAGAAASVAVLLPTSPAAADSSANCRFNQYGDFQCTILDSDTGCTFEYFGYYEEEGSSEPGGGSAIIC